MTTTASGLQYEDTVTGSGETAQAGHHVTVHYTGWLHDPRHRRAAAEIRLQQGSRRSLRLRAR